MSTFGPDYRWLSATSREIAEIEERERKALIRELVRYGVLRPSVWRRDPASVHRMLARRAPWRRKQRR